jgi:hypothetical protein
MTNKFQLIFGLMAVFGAFYLNNGKPKGPYTLTYEYGLLIVGTIGLAVLWLWGLRKKSPRERDEPESRNDVK